MKFRVQEEFDIIECVIVGFQREASETLSGSTITQGSGYFLLGTAGDEEYEWEFGTFTNGKYHIKNMDLGTIHAFVKTVDDDEIWESRVCSNTGLQKASQGFDNKRRELRYK